MMNRTILVGRLTKDPELRYTPTGVAVVNFTLAVNRTFSNKNGEKEADFINCIAWRKPAENLANYQRKGNLLGVDGRIQTSTYEGKDGNRVFKTDVVAENIQFLEPRKDENKQATTSTNMTNQMPPHDPFAAQQPINISAADLPF
ncbi:single-stranded DNA-binding protein [Listeria ivanovii]|uniref:Single-stranded DNA-binding protein n=1 Tax=Listeria ivanovii subsp. londoniensis TaxID=202752 RepID=A0ABS1G8N2_LISIV|nr:single-stranded DNA-binding protein [Listeria ivanovii]MBK1962951.1 single-stranded DNA-binding protein [Listeria ivanovii subsp. londoniensis]MBM5721753.1 single-stranded DNA-binding protein [Listeria ivanovii]UCK61728.1 single-stranded DNA-binding protein [Listeria ivanovii]